MKLCIVTHNILKGDGQGRVNYEIVWEAIRRKYHVTLVATNVAPDLQRHPSVNWILISVKGYPTQLLKGIVFSWKSAFWLQRNHCEFDIVLANGALTSFPAKINAVHFVHSSWLRSSNHPSRQHRNLHGAYQWLFTKLNAILEEKAFHQAAVIVAVSQQVKQDLICLGISNDKIQVILNGVDIQEFYPGLTDRCRWQLPEQIPIALFVGDIQSSRKNLETVLYALVKVPKLHLAIVGNTEKSPYPQLANTLGLAARVHFLGFQRDVASIMRTADFLVFPSRYETFGMVVTEAMASGLPVIVANTVGAAELITPDCGIVLQDSEDVAGLAKSLDDLASNAEQRQRMGQTARIIAEQYNWHTQAQIYVNLFEEVVGSSSKAKCAL